MSKEDPDQQRDEKDEKDEKEFQKREEKSVEEKWQRDPLGSLVWASILIWAGVVLLASNLGAFDLLTDFLERLRIGEDLPFEPPFVSVEGWSVFFFGAAAILLIEAAIRLLVPAYRRPVVGTLILAIVFLGLAFGTFNCVFPLILIAIGVSILLRNLGRKE